MDHLTCAQIGGLLGRVGRGDTGTATTGAPLDPFRPSGERARFDTGAGCGKGTLAQEVEKGTLISCTIGGIDTGGRIEISREGGSDDPNPGMKGSLRAMC